MAATATTSTTALTSLDEYHTLGRSGLRVSPLCLGTMTFGTTWGFGNNKEECKKIYDLYRSKGGNFIDTANVYQNGDSERFVGEYISSCRSEVVVATKITASMQFPLARAGLLKGVIPNINGGGNGRKSVVQNLDESLKRLGLGAVDLLYIHCWEYTTPVEEVIRTMDDVVRSGKAYHIGISDAPAWVVSQAQTIAALRGWTPFIALQTRYNLIDRDFEGELGPMSKELGLGVCPWGALAEGFLTGKHTNKENPAAAEGSGRKDSVDRHITEERNHKILEEVKAVAAEIKRTPAQVALNWLVARGCSSPILGARTLAQLEDNLGALEFTLTPEQLGRLNTVSAPKLAFPHGFVSMLSVFTEAGGKLKGRTEKLW